ncbi:putative sterol regulatory element binding protein sre1 protein [Erysiphe necator]|uniref:Putative sterol regulatory element binding protein sre1 protein n=1 Tax=Uncinula necator TaxID=52586 RepID=A0A0B1P660_UNCNE|nr:putative sterol regulatory element binding protein sre1 protein [Erysiphe necator]
MTVPHEMDLPSSLPYRDSLNPAAALSSNFSFHNFDGLKNTTASHSQTTLPLDDSSFYASTWEGTAQNETLYATPINWESSEPMLDYQPPSNLFTPNSFQNVKWEGLQSDGKSSNVQLYSHRSSQSLSSSKSRSVSSPENNDRNRKRKSIAELEDDEDDDLNPLVKKTAHNMIEKRYRTNLNDKIAALRDAVPSLRITSKSARGEDTMDDREELQGLKPAHKLNKATVLSKATEYIYHLENRNKILQQEILDHKSRLATYEALLRSNSLDCNTLQSISNPFQFSFDYPSPSTPHPVTQQTVVQESDNFQRQVNQPIYHNLPQEPYSQYQQQQPLGSNQWNGHSYMGKVMVGTMAALMILEGFSEEEQSSESPVGRGLFAVPMHILSFIKFLFKMPLEINIFGYQSSSYEVIWFFKFILIFSSVLYVILPQMFTSRSISNRGKIQNTLLSAAPSLASPIQVRRQAWLTAIQTVWVPRHNFLLEAAALCLKIAKISTRNICGSQAYTYLTGITEQQEAARIKAWNIALDAQLAGGDIEINKSRLTLTLLASATLPDTPARLMLNALHIRVLLWEIANFSFYGYCPFRGLASGLVKWKWKKAILQRELGIYSKDEADDLPDNLIVLLQQDSDYVFNDSIAQRAYNLAWNLPTTRNIFVENDCMDIVVDDFAIRGPLDAVAAWFSSFVLQKAISKSLQIKENNSVEEQSVAESIDLAIKIAPIGSTIHIRSLLARSILVKEKRGASIAETMQALGPLNKQISQNYTLNLINTGASVANIPDIELSLRCATAIAHIEHSTSLAYPEKAIKIIQSISPRKLSLLSFVATFKLMEKMNKHEIIATSCVNSLEIFAGVLRIWMGGKDANEVGLPIEVKKETIECCLAISKRIIGMQDAGYASMSESSDVNED